MELTNYKGHEVRVDEYGKFYTLVDGGTAASASTFIELKKSIDKMKVRIGLPVLLYLSGYWEKKGVFKLGTITSRQWKGSEEDSERWPTFRVQFPDKSWKEAVPSNLIKVTDKNNETIIQLTEKRAQVKRLETEIEALNKTFETYTNEELGIKPETEGA